MSGQAPERAYYNEFDKQAAQWLRNLITAGLIPPGDVDERSIEDVTLEDLKPYNQHHFFAGIGVWPFALRRAGWDDGRPVRTGSCPCQPFSAAGEGAGFADERHLWPAFEHLIRQYDQWCRDTGRPVPVIFGEQVASKAVDTWIDLVHADLEALGYAFGAIAFPSAGVGAPHIRDRTYWVADPDGGIGGQRRADIRGWVDGSNAQPRTRLSSSSSSMLGGLGHADHARLEGLGGGHHTAGGQREGTVRSVAEAGESGGVAPCQFCGYEFDHDLLGAYGCPNCGGEGLDDADSGLADADSIAGDGGNSARLKSERLQHADGLVRRREANEHVVFDMDGGGWTGPTNGFWRNADWLACRDGKWRPVEPGTFPLAHGAAARVVRLRAYGNAVNAQAAEEFVRAYLEVIAGDELQRSVCLNDDLFS